MIYSDTGLQLAKSVAVSVSAGTGGTAAILSHGAGASVTAKPGDTVLVNAVANSGYHFNNWTASAGTPPTNAQAYFTVPTGQTAVTLTANFEADATAPVTTTYTVEAKVNTDTNKNGGSAFVSGASTVESGQNVTVVAVPNPSTTTVSGATTTYTYYTFDGWTVGGTTGIYSDTLKNSVLTFTPTVNTTCTASFTKHTQTYTDTTYTFGTVVVEAGTGGTVAGGGTIVTDPEASKTSATIVAIPDEGYVFEKWTASNGGEIPSDSTTNPLTVSKAGTYTACFTAKAPSSYTVSTSAENGIVIGGGTYASGATAQLYVIPDAGYRFTVWSGDASGTSNPVTVNVDGDKTVTANFALLTYTVTYNANGGSNAPASQTKTHGTALTLSGTAPTRAGYTFKGWSTGGSAVQYTADGTYSADASVTLYAVWEANTYTVTFQDDTTTIASATFAHGATLGVLPNIAKEGYDFDGWYNGSARATSTTTVTGAITYTATWTQKSYGITWPSPTNYTLGGSETVSVNHGRDVTFTVTPSTGYTGANMVVSANGVALGATGVSGDTYTYTVKNITANQTITVSGVEKIKFPVTLSNGTGYTVSPTYQEVEYGGSLTLTVTPASGYSSVTVKNGETTLTPSGTTYTVTDVIKQPNITISATATPIYTVTFRSEGLIYSLVNVESETAVALPTGLTRTGYTFGGWSESDVGTTAVSETSVTVSADKTYYAIWTAETYTVSYTDGVDNEEITVPSSQTKTYNQTLTLSTDIPTRTGYTFAGWRSASGTVYPAGGEYTANAAVVLTAQWIINTYTVTYWRDGGNIYGRFPRGRHAPAQPSGRLQQYADRAGASHKSGLYVQRVDEDRKYRRYRE